MFGLLSLAVAFLVYDLLELGSLGTRLFLAVVDVVSYVLLAAFPRTFANAGLAGLDAAASADPLRLVLRLGGVVLVASFGIDLVTRTVHREPESGMAARPG